MMFRPLLAFFVVITFFSCGDPVEPEKQTAVQAPPMGPPTAPVYTFGVFANIDSAGGMHGVGYDIFQDGKKIIHQVSIPGEPGNEGFADDAQAGKVAQLVITKLEAASGFPTITRNELDSLGITLQSH